MDNFTEDFNVIFMSATGELSAQYQLPWVMDALPCPSGYAQAYQELYDARDRLCARHGIAPEAGEVEDIMNAVLHIERQIGMALFRCGIAYAQRDSSPAAEKRTPEVGSPFLCEDN